MDVKVTINRGRACQILIDGHDVSKLVLRRGFQIDITDPDQPTLSMVLHPRRLDLVGDFLVAVSEQDAPKTEETD